MIVKSSEKLLERKACDAVKAAGGLAIKLVAVSFTGLPDRLFLLPGGRICFAEIKSTGKNLSPRQEVVKKALEKLGFRYYVIDTEETLLNFKIMEGL